MQITIHRGTQEIGGSCVQVTSGGVSILLDAGSPLGNSSKHIDLSALDFGAVLVSHSHQDHYGLIEEVAPHIPIYIGEIGCKMVDAARVFTGRKPLANNFQHFEAWQWFDLPPFRIMPYLMDHSSIDSFGFLIEGEGKRIFYSGDFRAHGRKGQIFETFVANPPKNIDLLLMEGTMLGREGEAHQDEADVEKDMLDVLLSETGLAFLICSGQHIDRLCTAYRACKKAKRVFVVDIYTAWILHELAEHFDSTPHFRWDDIRVLAHGKTAKSHYLSIKGRSGFEDFLRQIYKRDNAITEQQIAQDPGRYFIKNNRIDLLLKSLSPAACSVIYSQWQGYLEEKYNPDSWKLTNLRDNPVVSFYKIHTSGHAFKKDLQRYAEAINAKQLVPIHTEKKELYPEYFSPKSIRLVADGESFEI